MLSMNIDNARLLLREAITDRLRLIGVVTPINHIVRRDGDFVVYLNDSTIIEMLSDGRIVR
jgi:hypothetical protein